MDFTEWLTMQCCDSVMESCDPKRSLFSGRLMAYNPVPQFKAKSCFFVWLSLRILIFHLVTYAMDFSLVGFRC